MRYPVIWNVIAFCHSPLAFGEQSPLLNSEEPPSLQSNDSQSANISLSDPWQILGPFRTGTRETAWGADPLDAYGGFGSVDYDPDATFASALAPNGVVRWSTLSVEELVTAEGYARAALDVGFPDINWPFLRSIYGWAAVQYQAWARGNLTVSSQSPVTVSISTPGLLEIWVDKKPYFGGDFYSYRRASLILTLEPGRHVVELRLVRDVRAMGGNDDPRINAIIHVNQVTQQLTINSESLLVAEVVGGRLASPLASVTLQNAFNTSAEVVSIRAVDESGPDLSLSGVPLRISPFQTRPVIFRIDHLPEGQAEFSFEISYRLHGESGLITTEQNEVKLQARSMSEPQKYTFIHPSGIISYAIIRPPLNEKCRSPHGRALPVLLSLHGAGLEADSDQVRHMLDDAYGVCAWGIFPTGVTQWSGDDWHTWGFADVQAAVTAIPDWMESVGWDGSDVSLDDWIVSGHSNGGQGTWFLLSHQPDKVIAAAPVSGFTSIQNYVPYTLWQSNEALLTGVFDTALQSYKHEMLVANFAGIPIHQQHGSEDDNVPAYHSRLMHQIIGENNWHSTYDELAGEGHWFKGVLTTKPLVEFYHLHANKTTTDTLPIEFSIVVATSGDMGSRGGLFVDQLQSPERYGRIHVTRDVGEIAWRLKTRNIHRFHLVLSAIRAPHPQQIIIDESYEPFVIRADEVDSTWFVYDGGGQWEMSQDDSWRSLSQRYGRQMGTMDAILRTTGALTIVSSSQAADEVALQISRNLFQYFAADSQLLTTAVQHSKPVPSFLATNPGNVITVALGEQLEASQLEGFPIRLEDNRLLVSRSSRNDAAGDMETSYDLEPGLGAIFLRPLSNERLELMVWGTDLVGLQHSARLVPMLTGTGQPDFVVLCFRCRWESRGEVYAAGFFDHSWQTSLGSYIS